MWNAIWFGIKLWFENMCLFYLVVMARVQEDSRWWSLGFVLFIFCSSFIIIFLPVFFINNHTNFMETEKAKKILEELNLLILDWSNKQNIPMTDSIVPTYVIYHIISLFWAIQNGAQKASLRNKDHLSTPWLKPKVNMRSTTNLKLDEFIK